MSKQVLVRLGFSDVVISKEDNENFNGHIDCIDEDGNEIASTEAYLIGYEYVDEDGEFIECNEDGDAL